MWGGRLALIGGLLLAAALIGGAVLLFAGDDEEGDGPTEAELAEQRAAEVDELLSESAEVKAAGIGIRHPADWKAKKEGAIVNLDSADRCIAISVSAPVSAAESARLSSDSIKALETAGKVQTQKLAEIRIDGRPAEGTLIALRSEKGAPVAVRQYVVKGKRFGYLVQTVYRAPPCADSAPTADLIVGNLDLSK